MPSFSPGLFTYISDIGVPAGGGEGHFVSVISLPLVSSPFLLLSPVYGMTQCSILRADNTFRRVGLVARLLVGIQGGCFVHTQGCLCLSELLLLLEALGKMLVLLSHIGLVWLRSGLGDACIWWFLTQRHSHAALG